MRFILVSVFKFDILKIKMVLEYHNTLLACIKIPYNHKVFRYVPHYNMRARFSDANFIYHKVLQLLSFFGYLGVTGNFKIAI